MRSSQNHEMKSQKYEIKKDENLRKRVKILDNIFKIWDKEAKFKKTKRSQNWKIEGEIFKKKSQLEDKVKMMSTKVDIFR